MRLEVGDEAWLRQSLGEEIDTIRGDEGVVIGEGDVGGRSRDVSAGGIIDCGWGRCSTRVTFSWFVVGMLTSSFLAC